MPTCLYTSTWSVSFRPLGMGLRLKYMALFRSSVTTLTVLSAAMTAGSVTFFFRLPK